MHHSLFCTLFVINIVAVSSKWFSTCDLYLLCLQFSSQTRLRGKVSEQQHDLEGVSEDTKLGSMTPKLQQSWFGVWGEAQWVEIKTDCPEQVGNKFDLGIFWFRYGATGRNVAWPIQVGVVPNPVYIPVCAPHYIFQCRKRDQDFFADILRDVSLWHGNIKDNDDHLIYILTVALLLLPQVLPLHIY